MTKTKTSRTAAPAELAFLDYTIVISGTADGIVLTKKGPKAELWECHLGNYSTVQDAKESALEHFMIARPAIFHASVHYRMHGSAGYHEWFLFKRTCQQEGIRIPGDVVPSTDMNYTVRVRRSR